VVQAAAMFTASQFHRPEFNWFSGRRGFLRCCGYAVAAPVRISIAKRAMSTAVVSRGSGDICYRCAGAQANDRDDGCAEHKVT
jgi:hypothetical protein